MCTIVCVGDSDLLETVGGLASALGLEPEELSPYGKDSCLCGVDLEAAARKVGKTVRNCTDDPGFPWPEYIIE